MKGPKGERIDHDALFKRLIGTFVLEFLELFVPSLVDHVEAESLALIDKEIFTDLAEGERHVVDLLVRFKVRGEDRCILIHVENQASHQRDFDPRMFRYYAHLTLKYKLDVYPIALLSYDTPAAEASHQYTVDFPGKRVLQFDYDCIQLNRLDWKSYLGRANPVAIALMAKMRIEPADRPKVMLECRRMLGTLQLNPADTEFILAFVETYLKLTGEEFRVMETLVEALPVEEKEKFMIPMSSAKREGYQEGQQEGRREALVSLLEGRFGELTQNVLRAIDRLEPGRMKELGQAVWSFATIAELDQWLAAQR